MVLSVESGAQEKTFQKFAPDLLKEMNIDLQVVAHPSPSSIKSSTWTSHPALDNTISSPTGRCTPPISTSGWFR